MHGMRLFFSKSLGEHLYVFEDTLGKISVFILVQAALLSFHGMQWEILHWRIFSAISQAPGRPAVPHAVQK